MVTADLVNELKMILPEERIGENHELDHPLGNSGKVKVCPETEEEISKLLNYANLNGKTISVVSGGTKRGFGGLSENNDLLLSLENYKGIVEHTVGDMTLTVKPGTSFKELQDYLAKHNQKIALDPAWPEDATIGGIIAANESGPKRLGYGSSRDAVIGLRVVYPDGQVIRAGGKVVKNVAGYDMNKLFIGSMGTLGVLSEVTLKLRPLPKYESLILLSFPEGKSDEMKSFAVKLLDSMLEPVSLELLSPSLSEKLTGEKLYTLVIAFEDVESSVHYQEDMVKKMKPFEAKLEIYKREKAQEFWNAFYKNGPNGARSSSTNETEASLKVGVVNLDVLEIVRESELLRDSHNLVVEAHGGLGHGLCQIHVRGAIGDVESAIKHLRESAEKNNGYAIVKHLPYSLRQKVNVWGDNPSYFFLLQGIKSKIDSNGIMNPRRFVGGI
ncbi:FAD-binding oxidoreductase [Bacillus dakarensis]|uniref:FAD-binding oxidoreductase n=1 Tax=Robertmurraya dakarensis TaxID=1926278 RepID=UPI000980C2DB|nr:FAD-binding oxidoreductase [Bacillus dakarensis]